MREARRAVPFAAALALLVVLAEGPARLSAAAAAAAAAPSWPSIVCIACVMCVCMCVYLCVRVCACACACACACDVVCACVHVHCARLQVHSVKNSFAAQTAVVASAHVNL